MATTIQVSQLTRQVLEKLKTEEKAHSFDEVIQILVKKVDKVPSSMFGSATLSPWTKKDRMDFHES